MNQLLATVVVLIVVALSHMHHGNTAHAFTNGILPDFVQRAFAPKPDLQSIAAQFFPGTILDIRLDVADPNSSAATKNKQQQGQPQQRMAIQNLVLQLLGKEQPQAQAHYKNDKELLQAAAALRLPMPGFHGPHPATSSGVGGIAILQSGHFIDMTGQVPLQWTTTSGTTTAVTGGSWELVWRQNAPSGSLICALDLASDAVRNQAKLPKGLVYVTFPVWNREKLTEYQAYKVKCEAASQMHLKDRDDEILKLRQTNNVLAKAMHYRNAFAALEQYSLQPHEAMAKVPTNDNELIVIDNDNVLLSTKGVVWSKAATAGPTALSFFSPVQRNVLLGHAFLKKPSPLPPPTHPTSSSSLGVEAVIRGTLLRNDDDDIGGTAGVVTKQKTKTDLSKLAP